MPKKFVITRKRKICKKIFVFRGTESTQCTETVKKILNFTAISIGLFICTWQVGICFKKYFDQIIGTQTTLEIFKSYTFPTLYICPHAANQELSKAYKSICYNHSDCQEDIYFDALNINTQELWKLNSVNIVYAKIECQFSMNKTVCNNFSSEIHKKNVAASLDTILGNCRILNTSELYNLLKYQDLQRDGRRKSVIHFRITILPSSLVGDDFPVTVTLSSDNFNERYLIFYEFLGANKSVWMDIISVKEFHRVPPCKSEAEYVKCINECFDKVFYKELYDFENNERKVDDSNCMLPFIKSSVEIQKCRSIKQLNDTYMRSLKVELHKSQCNCPKRCVKILYTATSLKIANENRGIFLGVKYSPTSRDVVKEYYIYPLSALVSELAGNIGFYAGLSLLGILQFVCKSLFVIFQVISTNSHLK